MPARVTRRAPTLLDEEDGSGDADPLRASDYGVDASDPEQVKRSPAAAFDLALMNVATAAEAFAGEAADLVPGALAARYAEDVEALHDRMIETLWSEESTRRVEIFERQIARALTTLADVCAAAPSVAPRARPVEEALGELAAVWRGL